LPAKNNEDIASEPDRDPEGPGAPPPDKKADESLVFDPRKRPKNPHHTPPEDVGEDFSVLPTEVVVERLSSSEDRIEQRKAAKVLGDRAIAGKLELSPEERRRLDEYVDKQIEVNTGATPTDWSEAKNQIQRLWRLSADRLIANLGHENIAASEAALKNLVLMRNEDIVKKIIAEAKTTKNQNAKLWSVLALGMMNERAFPFVRDRETIGQKTAARLAETLVIPFLEELRKSDKDPDMQRMIQNAFYYLANPFDKRPRNVK